MSERRLLERNHRETMLVLAEIRVLTARFEAFLATWRLVMADESAAVAALQADAVALRSAADNLVAFVKTIPDQIKAAVDAAIAAGSQPDQLTALTDLHTSLSGTVAEMAAALPAPAPAPAPDPAPEPAPEPAPDSTPPASA